MAPDSWVAAHGGHQADIELILSKRHHKDGDFWATPDGRVYVGNPFSTIGSLLILHELGVTRDHEAVEGGLALILDAWRADGRIKVGPSSPMYACYTAEAARALCRWGLADDDRVQATLDYFLASTHSGGGWRCSFSRFGKGPETEHANPGATLYALDALRFTEAEGAAVDSAVEFLLGHWETKEPLGPCHWGIGTTFMKAEYPFLRFNLFFWVYVLSFFSSAREDRRFRKAVEALRENVDDDGRFVVAERHRSLSGLAFCARGKPSDLATGRYREIEERMAEAG